MENYRLTAVYKKENTIISLYEDDEHDFIYILDMSSILASVKKLFNRIMKLIKNWLQEIL